MNAAECKCKHGVIWKHQFYDSPGDSLLPALNMGSLFTCLGAV